MTKIWRVSEDDPENLLGTFVGDPLRAHALKSARRFTSEGDVFIFRFQASGKTLSHWDCVANNVLLPLVNERVASIVARHCAEEVQLVEAAIETSDGVLDGYRILNPLREVAAVDMAASEVVRIPGSDAIVKFNRVRFRPEGLGTSKIAREARYHPFLLVADDLAKAIQGAGVIGASFLDAEAVHP